MADLTSDTDRLLQEGDNLLRDNRKGGRHRRMGSIGTGSKRLKANHLMAKIKRIVMAAGAVIMAAIIAGLVLDGIGFTGIMLSAIAIVCAVAVFSAYPKIQIPKRADLTKGDLRQMVGKTELWLEHQRSALPPPAAAIVDDMGMQLDALGLQIEDIDENHPAIRDVRKLVGEVLPETIESYRKIPAHLRAEKHAGTTPDSQVTESLANIAKEIDSTARQLAEGSLDDLAIKTRYLEYRYGEGSEPGEGPG